MRLIGSLESDSPLGAPRYDADKHVGATSMRLPQFTAEESLLSSTGYYRTNAGAVGGSVGCASSIVPAEAGEVIDVHGCAPGSVLIESGSSWDCLPRSLVDWLLDPGGGVVDPPIPPGGGGGGGGGPASVPPDIVTECLKVGGKFGEKYCGGIGGPSTCKTCAQIVCQQKKCKDSKRCDPNQLNGAKEANCDIGCPDVPGCKDGLTVKKIVITNQGVFELGNALAWMQ